MAVECTLYLARPHSEELFIHQGMCPIFETPILHLSPFNVQVVRAKLKRKLRQFTIFFINIKNRFKTDVHVNLDIEND